ncbi:MAG: ATP-binding protein [Oscillospiraceae bacterium]|nr:ATP-binding protein [Oscillospiraceae bacterium]
MLLQFSVENFKSIKQKAILSLEASADQMHVDNYAQAGKDKCLRMVSVYGANAAGKSNLFQALTAAILAVRLSNDRQVGAPIPQITPFLFDPETAKAPTSFEFIFITEGLKYVYGFSATSTTVETEYLYVYKTAKATTIFERDVHSKPEYRFTSPSLRKQLLPITERNTPNKLFLATATAWNCEETRIPLLWLTNGINTYSPDYESLLQISGEMFERDTDQSLRIFTNRLLQEADVNISDYEFESTNYPKEDFMRDIGVPPAIRENFSMLPNFFKRYDINTLHRIETDRGENVYTLPLRLESRGTRNVFLLSPILKRAFETGETVCVDEFDTSLHPMLVSYLVGLFHNPAVNRNNAQLIITTHDLSLLTLKELRRDQIYFVEKDQNTGESELYSLDEFSPRTNEDVRKAYMLGRYGSVPNVGDGDLLWQ